MKFRTTPTFQCSASPLGLLNFLGYLKIVIKENQTKENLRTAIIMLPIEAQDGGILKPASTLGTHPTEELLGLLAQADPVNSADPNSTAGDKARDNDVLWTGLNRQNTINYVITFF